MKLGLLLDYPNGEPEELEIITEGTDWIKFDIQGKWFPDAFIGVMANMQRFKNGEEKLMGFFIGQINRKTKGKISHKIIIDELKKKLNN